MSSPFQLVHADLDRDRERVLALWRSGLAQGGMPEAKLAWFYRERPGPPADVLMLCNAEGPIGVACIAARRMQCGPGRFIEAGTLTDFVVMPEYRGFFAALALQRATREHGVSHYALLFGTPNPQSEAVVKRAGYRLLGENVRFARVLRSAPYLSRRLPRWIASVAGGAYDGARRAVGAWRWASVARRFSYRWLEAAPDERFDALWVACAAVHPGLIGVRDRAFLDWRFARCPLHAHRFFVLEDGAGALLAYAVCDERDGALRVSDFLVDPRVEGAGAALWRALAREAYRDGIRALSVTLMADSAVIDAIRAGGLVAREARPVFGAFAAGSADLQALPWYLTGADIDV